MVKNVSHNAYSVRVLSFHLCWSILCRLLQKKPDYLFSEEIRRKCRSISRYYEVDNDLNKSENSSEQKSEIFGYIYRTTHCTLWLFSFVILLYVCTCHTQDAPGHNHSGFSLFFVSMLLLLMLLLLLFPYAFPFFWNKNFVTAYRPEEKVSNNLDAKCMMKRSWKLTRQGFIIMFEWKEANQR